jgi:crotonobetainyl-CoA:carnitine CoA-transferase CaiB-like acyl-CoA transferase
MGRDNVPNPLVNTYRTSDDRYVALCMLQPDVYWEPFCRAIGRDDLVTDPRFSERAVRTANGREAVEELTATFAAKPLEEWKPILAAQRGQWDVVKKVSEVLVDPQAVANGFVQHVDYGEGRELPLVANPVQFDRTPPDLGPAPGFASDTDELLLSLGWDWDRIIEAKASGAVV